MWVFRLRELPKRSLVWTGGLAALACGCTTPETRSPLTAPVPGPRATATRPVPAGPIQQAAYQKPAPPTGSDQPVAAAPTGVDDFVRLAVERNPRLARANLAIDAARGRHVQAGLYPNPEVAVNWDEIGDRSSSDRLGILTAPKLTQTIVTGKKLTLAQAVAAREIDQATLELVAERYAIAGSVRSAFYEALALQKRAEILDHLAKLADEAVSNGKTLLDASQLARLDYVQLEIERERFRAELLSVKRELPGVYRRLAAVAGAHAAIPASVTGTFEGLPEYEADVVREAVLAYHPQVRSAHVGIERARAAVARAEAEPIPNVSVYTGFVRQFENKSYDGAVGIAMPVPVWNRNQGNIQAAKAELGMAIQSVGQVENELAARVATAYQSYAAARARAAVYQKELIPRAEETYKLSLAAFRGGQFEYLKVIQAQRALAEAQLEANRALGEAWRAAAELSGLLLEDWWPGPRPAPVTPPVPPPAKKDKAP
ncbi:Cobalt-zinc-cadmium resistance protein CzcC precursor [Gemmata sp. SH-PL17]|uniref:TolC family protein n=1 Tax=Gemmata sp. SH-PL17 TaxID=1630693 RepID=UPI00078BA6A3|nr:TolC family protein [Gemmata sp. SH-PL17]AMV28732.1 Cobalt-zinc-cadmium resistance protein CzcC precursor [Gemmata sp. SH-PL17]